MKILVNHMERHQVAFLLEDAVLGIEKADRYHDYIVTKELTEKDYGNLSKFFKGNYHHRIVE